MCDRTCVGMLTGRLHAPLLTPFGVARAPAAHTDGVHAFLTDLINGVDGAPASVLAAKMKAATAGDQGADIGVNRAVWAVAAALILVRVRHVMLGSFAVYGGGLALLYA